MNTLRKTMAWFAIYNSVSILFIVLVIASEGRGVEVDYSGIAAGVYIGAAVVFALVAASVLAIGELLK